MQLIPECLKALKYSEFWEISENPSLLSFLEYRLHNNLGQEDTEHSRYKKELETILEYHDKTSEPGKIALQLLKKFQVNVFHSVLYHFLTPITTTLLVACW